MLMSTGSQVALAGSTRPIVSPGRSLLGRTSFGPAAAAEAATEDATPVAPMLAAAAAAPRKRRRETLMGGYDTARSRRSRKRRSGSCLVKPSAVRYAAAASAR